MRFDGHGTNVVQEALVTLTPTADLDDGDQIDGTLTVQLLNFFGFFTSFPQTNLTGGLTAGTPDSLTVTHVDDDKPEPAAGSAGSFSPYPRPRYLHVQADDPCDPTDPARTYQDYADWVDPLTDTMYGWRCVRWQRPYRR